MDRQGRKCVDLALVIDCTGSMESYIDSTRNNIEEMFNAIDKNENVNLRVACVGFRDHATKRSEAKDKAESPELIAIEKSFVTKIHTFTKCPGELEAFLSNIRADFGYDEAEAVADGLNSAVNLSWKTDATKICFLITDAPPHGISSEYDNFPDGCPCGIDPLEEVQKMAETGISLYVLGCQPSITEYRSFYMGLAHKTGGLFIPLTITDDIASVIKGCIAEELDMERLFAEMEDGVVKADLAVGPNVDESEITQQVHDRWKINGTLSKQLHYNDMELGSALHSVHALVISFFVTTAEVKAYRGEFRSHDKGFRFGSPKESQPLPEGERLSSLEGELLRSHGYTHSRLLVVPEPLPAVGSGGFRIEVKPVSMAQTSRLIRKSLAKNVVNKLKRM